MSAEENRRVVRRYFELWNSGDFSRAEEIISPSIVVHDSFARPGAYGSGAAGLGQFVSRFRSAFPDLHFAIDDEIVDGEEGEKVVVRWTMSGTQLGPFRNMPPTGRQMKVSGIDIYRIAGGRIEEWWVEFNAFGMLQQLGMIPPPPGGG